MTDKENLIKAFQSLDFNELNSLLDDTKSYMDVSKSTFLNALRKEIERHEELQRYMNRLKKEFVTTVIKDVKRINLKLKIAHP